MIIDLHAHYTLTQCRATVADRFSFEPLPTATDARAPLPTDFDSCTSPRALERRSWRIARWLFDLPAGAAALDAYLAREYLRHLTADGPIDRTVLLAFDAVHDDDGTLVPLPGRGDRFGSDIYTSNSFVRDLCRRHPQHFLFGASVHPYRRDAVECVDEVSGAGAVLLKWIPQHHNIDVTDPRTNAVLERCAARGLPLLLHYGEEFTLRTHRRAYCSIRPLLDVLDRLRQRDAMPTVIIAHLATPATPLGERDSHRALVAALTGRFADAPLYADISALGAWGKIGYLRRIARTPALHRKLVFGSDFPVPPGLPRLRRDLGRDYARIRAVGSWPQQYAHVCRTLGISEIVLHRAGRILPESARSAPPPPSP
jgi:predicted TIM-barrel fold metal-dependent hydrolase